MKHIIQGVPIKVDLGMNVIWKTTREIMGVILIFPLSVYGSTPTFAPQETSQCTQGYDPI